MLLVLLPSRELREDLARDIIGNHVFLQQEILWLGRPPTDSALGMWDELLQDRLKEIQIEAWRKLHQIKEDFVHVLSQLNNHRGPEPEGSARRTSQAEGRDKNDQAWSYGALFCQTEVDLHNKDWGLDTYLEDLFLTKQVLRQHILLEVASILGERDAALKSIARRARVVLATADAFTKFVAKCSSGPASAILKEKKVEVAFLTRCRRTSWTRSPLLLAPGMSRLQFSGGIPTRASSSASSGPHGPGSHGSALSREAEGMSRPAHSSHRWHLRRTWPSLPTWTPLRHQGQRQRQRKAAKQGWRSPQTRCSANSLSGC